MPSKWPRAMCTLLLASLLASCAHVQKPARQPADDTGASRAKAPSSKERLMLSEGYSILYRDAGNLDLSDLILYVKSESDAMKKVVTEVADMGEQLKKDLERIAADYPAVRIDLDPLPEMEKRKRAAVGKSRARQFAPVIGEGGREYERTVLLSYANGLNHERHLCRVMAEAEPEASLKKFLLETGKRYDALYERVTALLEKEYFKNP
jgi:hypothetical protein